MAQIYKINDVLHGCDVIETIFKNAEKMKYSGKNIESYIYLVGCYAGATGDAVLRYKWKYLRRLFNAGFTSGSLYDFRNTYNGACCRIRTLLGVFAWYNTLNFGK